MSDFLTTRRNKRRVWCPSPNKVSWTDYCQQKIDADPEYARRISDGSPDSLFMSDDIIRLVAGSTSLNVIEHKKEKALNLLLSLRPEDAIHIPHVRFDYDTGKIIDWNRSMCDLTGISAAQIVGKSYAEVLEEWCPNLSKEYKDAALEWIKKREDRESQNITEMDHNPEDVRAEYLFPLPLPLRKRKPSFKYASNSRQYDEYVELLVSKADQLFQVYPQFFHSVPQTDYDEARYKPIWNFDTIGWVGGVELILRRKQQVSSLQSLCRELLPKGEHALNEDGSLVATNAASKPLDDGSSAPNNNRILSDYLTTCGPYPRDLLPKWNEDGTLGVCPNPEPINSDALDHDYRIISDYLKTCGPIGIKYIREVMSAVHRKCRNFGMGVKTFHFSTDWSSHTETSAIHNRVLSALGGDFFITETITKKKMTWTLNFKVKGDEVDGWRMRQDPKTQAGRRTQYIGLLWTEFKEKISPIIRENKHSIITSCGATDSNSILPGADRPELTVLTLKIEGYVRSDGDYREEKFKAHATVQVPASLNFFQLHRVICMTMNNRPSATRETHEWKVPNLADEHQYSPSEDNFEYVQLGETYFVEKDYMGIAKRVDDEYKQLFDTGAVLRQRVSLTGAHVDQDMPLYFLGELNEEKKFIRNHFRQNYGQIKACIHTTCINSVFFQPGAYALMQDGLCRNFTTYKVTCMKSEEYKGQLPLNPDINIMQPKCLRGKPEEGYDHWSVEVANEQLHRDRGCLRRKLCKIGANGYMVQMPWCRLQFNPQRHFKLRYPAANPIAGDLRGLDDHPIFLYGEPPLPSSEGYNAYVSSLRGNIDPDFLQENVHEMYGDFSVPFGRRPRRRRYSFESELPETEITIGDVWTREVDEEIQRIESLQPNERAKGKKRKTPSKTPAS